MISLISIPVWVCLAPVDTLDSLDQPSEPPPAFSALSRLGAQERRPN